MTNRNILWVFKKNICLFVTYFEEKVYFCNRKQANK